MADSFTFIKQLHLACAALSIGGFVLRGVWMLRASPLLKARLTRILPHVNDTLLFGAGLWLMVTTRQVPDQHPWLTAKLIAIVVYILLGMVALKRGRSPRIRAAAFVAALTTFGYIVAVALTRSPWPF
jgi:uncharacterized membrane protein SirB2